jgi:hypothetical protein
MMTSMSSTAGGINWKARYSSATASRRTRPKRILMTGLRLRAGNRSTERKERKLRARIQMRAFLSSIWLFERLGRKHRDRALQRNIHISTDGSGNEQAPASRFLHEVGAGAQIRRPFRHSDPAAPITRVTRILFPDNRLGSFRAHLCRRGVVAHPWSSAS